MKFPPHIRVFGDTSFRGPCPSESAEQVTFFNQLRSHHPDTYGRVALHPRNEGQLIAGQHSSLGKQKAEGMSVGASDIIIPGAPAFVVELKRQDHTKSSWQPGQVEYLEAAQATGCFVAVALGWKAAWEAFQEWLETHQK